MASLLIAPSATRDRLTANMFLPKDDEDPVHLIERALEATVVAEPIHAKIRAAVREGRVDGRVAPDAPFDALARLVVACRRDRRRRGARSPRITSSSGAWWRSTSAATWVPRFSLPAIEALQRQGAAPARRRVAAEA